MVLAKNKNRQAFFYFFIVVVFFVIIFLCGDKEPKVFLWAWERPENLLFLKDQNVGVAFFAGGVVYNGENLVFRKRFQQLLVPEGTFLMPAIRIDNFSSRSLSLLEENEQENLANFIVEICSVKDSNGCQIDFDAQESERLFYKKLITKVRKNLSNNLPLSITALVSWCNKDSWLNGLPVQEIVPMFYELGEDDYIVKNNLVGGDFMDFKNCQKAIGISDKEEFPDSDLLKGRKIYLFSYSSWTEKSFSAIINKFNTQL